MEPTMQEGIQLPELLQKIKALREAGLRAEHVAFSFMKRRVQPLMACDTLRYQYTGDDDTSRMPSNEVDDDDIVERPGSIFKDMPPYTPCPVPEYSAARPPNKVGDRTCVFEYPLYCSSRAHPNCLLHDEMTKFVSDPASPPLLVDIPEEGKGKGKGKERREVDECDDTITIEDNPMRRTGRRFRSGSSCGLGSAILDCPMCPSLMIHRRAWRPVSLRRQ
jgi:hypothetical protein